MALFDYMKKTQLLLSDPEFAIYNDGDIVTYINMGRGQIAGEAECCRVYGTLAVTAASQSYLYSAINISGTPGLQGVLNVRQVNYAVANGSKPLHSRAWPWFQTFILGKPVPKAGPPSVWSEYAQGGSGSLYINLPDGPYTLQLDCVAWPADLALDTDPEALPYQWTDSVPFYAAYYASLTVGNSDKAEAMWKEYQKFVARARRASTSAVLPGNFAQRQDPFLQNRLGIQPRGQS